MNFLSGNLTVDPLVSALSTVNKSILFFSAFSLIGILLATSFLLIENNGNLQTSALKLKRSGQLFAGLWLVTSAFQIVITLANILGTSLSQALDPTTFRSFVTQVDLGKFLAAQTVLVLVVLVGLNFVKTALQSTAFLLVSLLALVAPVFQSHSAAGGSHSLAIGSLVIHVVSLSLWVGGIFAIAFLSDSDRKDALPRFSALALWGAIAVVISGVANAWARLDFVSAWSSRYAEIVIVKAILTCVLIYFGFRNRKALHAKSDNGWKFLTRLILIEAALMSLVLVLGSWLSNTTPPSGKEIPYSPALAIVGYQLLVHRI
jgi:putative copper resistance protein D